MCARPLDICTIIDIHCYLGHILIWSPIKKFNPNVNDGMPVGHAISLIVAATITFLMFATKKRLLVIGLKRWDEPNVPSRTITSAWVRVTFAMPDMIVKPSPLFKWALH